MAETLSILNESIRQEVMQEQLELLHHQEKLIPNSVQYSISRYRRQESWQIEDVGMLNYNFVKKQSAENGLELRFCVAGQRYCSHDECGTGSCKKMLAGCNVPTETLDLFTFRFTPSYLGQFVHGQADNTRAEQILSFQYKQAVTHIVPLYAKNRMVLESLFTHRYADSLGNIFLNAQIQALLLYSLDCLFGEKRRSFCL